MKKTTLAFCMFATIILAAVAGFGGATLANYVQNPYIFNSSLGKTEDATMQTANNLYEVEASTTNIVLNESGIVYENNLDAASALNAITAAYTAETRTASTIPQIAQSASGTVVEIETEQIMSNSRFGQYITSGAGSGVIISADGYIITCNHVIESANKITVRLKSGLTYEAKVIGRDTKTDLAVIKIETTGLRAARFGNSDGLVVGELAVAIGNPLGELGGTVTEGIISALNRDIIIDGETMNLMQTSAAVNPGNSGGALFNAYGELIGIVNAKSGGSNIEGIGFAIPSNMVKTIAEQLVQYGYVQGRVDFGITLVEISDMFTAMRYGVSNLGVYVGRDDADSGLKAGDLIVSINGKEVKTTAEVKAIYEQHKVGDKLELVIIRGGKENKASVILKQAKN